jgi:predicted HTH transcriptional regulator
MNSEGGVLLIGVADDGEILGLENDYQTLGGKGNPDGYELFLRELIDKSVSRPALTLMRVSFESARGKDVCRIDVAASAKPVFAKPKTGDAHSEFWVRLGNQTRQLHGNDMVDYQKGHWG